jgi:hypothetical protein
MIAVLWLNSGQDRIIICDEAFLRSMTAGGARTHAHFQDLNFKQPRHAFAISRRSTPELMSEACPSRMKRAQGMPDAR